MTHSNSRSVVQGGRNSRRLARGASYFRSSQWNRRIIEIIDESGVHSQQVLPGKMNIMSYWHLKQGQIVSQAKFSALEERVLLMSHVKI